MNYCLFHFWNSSMRNRVKGKHRPWRKKTNPSLLIWAMGCLASTWYSIDFIHRCNSVYRRSYIKWTSMVKSESEMLVNSSIKALTATSVGSPPAFGRIRPSYLFSSRGKIEGIKKDDLHLAVMKPFSTYYFDQFRAFLEKPYWNTN